MTSKPLLDYINRYVQMSADEEAALLSKIIHRTYLKGQFIVQQGDVCKYESFILSGCLRTFYVDRDGQEYIVMFGVEGWWAADFDSFITEKPSIFNIQCLENTEVIQFTYQELERLYTEIPKLERVFRIIFQRALVVAERRIVESAYLPAKEKYLKFRERYPDLDQRVPQYMIASYLGITKEFLSKIRNQLSTGQ